MSTGNPLLDVRGSAVKNVLKGMLTALGIDPDNVWLWIVWAIFGWVMLMLAAFWGVILLIISAIIIFLENAGIIDILPRFWLPPINLADISKLLVKGKELVEDKAKELGIVKITDADCRGKFGDTAFGDLTKGACYTCPPGFMRGIEGVDGQAACVVNPKGPLKEFSPASVINMSIEADTSTATATQVSDKATCGIANGGKWRSKDSTCLRCPSGYGWVHPFAGENETDAFKCRKPLDLIFPKMVNSTKFLNKTVYNCPPGTVYQDGNTCVKYPAKVPVYGSPMDIPVDKTAWECSKNIFGKCSKDILGKYMFLLPTSKVASEFEAKEKGGWVRNFGLPPNSLVRCPLQDKTIPSSDPAKPYVQQHRRTLHPNPLDESACQLFSSAVSHGKP